MIVIDWNADDADNAGLRGFFYNKKAFRQLLEGFFNLKMKPTPDATYRRSPPLKRPKRFGLLTQK